MRNDKLILLNINSDVIYGQLFNILQKSNYLIERAKNIQSVIQKTIELSPDLIISDHDSVEYDAFQKYNLLKKAILDCAIPYVVYIDSYESEDIKLGLDLGIDNFIFAPLDENRIIAKLKLLFDKIDRHKAFDKSSFDQLFYSSPVGVIICDSGKVERANQAFYRLFPFCDEVSFTSFDDIFNFNNARDKKKQFVRCINGLTNECIIKDVSLKGGREYQVNLLLSNISTLVKNRTLIQFEIKSDISTDTNKDYSKEFDEADKPGLDSVLTAREFDVLKISEKGVPVKLIAAELGISQRTVEKHRSNIMRKTDSVNIIEAIDKLYGISPEL